MYKSNCCNAGVKPDCGHPNPTCNKCNLPCEAIADNHTCQLFCEACGNCIICHEDIRCSSTKDGKHSYPMNVEPEDEDPPHEAHMQAHEDRQHEGKRLVADVDEFVKQPLTVLYDTLLFCDEDVIEKEKSLKTAKTAARVAGVRFSDAVHYKLKEQHPDYDHQRDKLTKFSFSHDDRPVHFVLEKGTCKPSLDQPKVLT